MFNAVDAAKDILRGFKRGIGGDGGLENLVCQGGNRFGLGALRVIEDQAFQIGIGVGGVELHGQVKEIDGLVDFAMGALDDLRGDVAGERQFFEHVLDLAGSQQVVK